MVVDISLIFLILNMCGCILALIVTGDQVVTKVEKEQK